MLACHGNHTHRRAIRVLRKKPMRNWSDFSNSISTSISNCSRSQATELGDHRFDALLDDVSKPARDKWLAEARKTLDELPKQVDYKSLSRDGQVDYEILKHHLETEIWLTENLHPFEEDPRTYVNYINDSVYLILTRSTLPKETNISNCIARMSQIPKVVAAAKENLTHPSRVTVDTAIRQNRGMISFYENQIFELAGETSKRDELKKAAAAVATQLKDYQTFLERDLVPRATGEWRIGKEKFSRKLDLVLDSGMTADEVYANAQAEFDRVRRDMYVVARQLWSQYYPKKPLPPDDADGRRTTIRLVIDAVGHEHGKPDALGERCPRNGGAHQIVHPRERHFAAAGPRPLRSDRNAGVQARQCDCVSRFGRAAGSARPVSFFAISPPAADWSAERAETFLQEYNKYMLQMLTIHEAYPGHYVQLEYAHRVPSLVRKALQSGVYIEGWAVYTEQMMLDQGYGAGDLRLRLMQLKFFLRAVANSIITHRMHCTEVSDDEILKFLLDEAFQSEAEAREKIIRTKQSTTQLSTYFVGRTAMYNLRQQSRTRNGGQVRFGPVPRSSDVGRLRAGEVFAGVGSLAA